MMYSRVQIVSVLLAFLLVGFIHPTIDSNDKRQTEARGDVGFIQQLFYLDKMKPDVERIGLIWKEGIANQEKKLERAKRAAAAIKGKLYVAYVDDKSDVPEKFRAMIQKHDVQTLWIVGNDGVVSASTPQKYLIENAVKNGIPLLAPSMDWVDAGAPLAIGRSNGEIEIMLNEPAADATGLKIPDKYKSQTNPVVASN